MNDEKMCPIQGKHRKIRAAKEQDAGPCKWFHISAKRLGEKNKIKCINHFSDDLKLNTHSSAINRWSQRTRFLQLCVRLLEARISLSVSNSVTYALLRLWGNCYNSFHISCGFGIWVFGFRFCLWERSFLHELLLANGFPPRSQQNCNCLQLICIL